MQAGTRAEFAAHMNRNKSTVTRWDQAGKLAFTQDGLVDFEKSTALIANAADPAKHGVTLRHARERGERLIEQELFVPVKPSGTSAAADPEPTSPEGDTSYARFNESRALKEGELAKLAKIKREEQEALLIRRSDVKRDVESLAMMVSKGLTGIPARVMPLINGEADAGKREQILENEIRKVLAEFADAALSLAGT